MKTKTIAWTAAEDAALQQAAIDNVSAERLSVRIRRSVASIKRRMRELGLRGKKRERRKPDNSVIPICIDPLAQVAGWLKACKSGNLVALMGFYSERRRLNAPAPAQPCSQVYLQFKITGHQSCARLICAVLV